MPSQQLFIESTAPQVILLAGLFYCFMILAGTGVAVSLLRRTLNSPLDWRSRIEWLCDRPWTWREGTGIFAILGLLIFLFMAVSPLLPDPRAPATLFAQSLLLDMAGIGVIAAFACTRGWSWSAAFGATGNLVSFFKLGLVFYLALMPFMLFSSLVYQGILVTHGYPQSLQDIALLISGAKSPWLKLCVVVLAMVIAPVFEEYLFRGILLPVLARPLGLGPGVFLSSLAFACIHAHLPSLVPLTVVATGFSLAYLYSRSLWVPIAMHSLFNGINLSLLFLIY